MTPSSGPQGAARAASSASLRSLPRGQEAAPADASGALYPPSRLGGKWEVYGGAASVAALIPAARPGRGSVSAAGRQAG